MFLNHPLVAITLKSLKEHPEDWTRDRYRVSNPKLGMAVWIANRIAGLSIEVPGRSVDYGKVTFWSAVFGWFIPWRVAVYRNAMKIPIDNDPATVGRDLEAKYKAMY